MVPMPTLQSPRPFSSSSSLSRVFSVFQSHAQATKLAVIVKMLLGEIPERDIFRQPKLERSLKPYFQLTQSAGRAVLHHAGVARRSCLTTRLCSQRTYHSFANPVLVQRSERVIWQSSQRLLKSLVPTSRVMRRTPSSYGMCYLSFSIVLRRRILNTAVVAERPKRSNTSSQVHKLAS